MTKDKPVWTITATVWQSMYDNKDFHLKFIALIEASCMARMTFSE